MQIKTYLNSDAIVIKEEVSKSKSAITVYAESTPNPSVLKFVCNKALVGQICEFSSIDDAKISPMATELFQLPFVKSVFMDKNYISITKYDVTEWEEITEELFQEIFKKSAVKRTKFSGLTRNINFLKI